MYIEDDVIFGVDSDEVGAWVDDCEFFNEYIHYLRLYVIMNEV